MSSLSLLLLCKDNICAFRSPGLDSVSQLKYYLHSVAGQAKYDVTMETRSALTHC